MSAQFEESGLIQKRKRLETTYKKFERLLYNLYNVTYTVLLLHAHK